LRHFTVLLASITLVATSASYVGDYRRWRLLSSVQQIHRGVGLISDSGRGSSPPRLTCRGDRRVMESCYWLHRNNAWHAGWSEQVSSFGNGHKRLKCAKRDLPIQLHHRDARTLGVPQCFFSMCTKQLENCDRASMQNASLSATANERHEISLLSGTKLRAKMELLVKVDVKSKLCATSPGNV
jgi:hypothetical protein